ncbi:putative beta-fructofuranosidase [Helianthus anomalus]
MSEKVTSSSSDELQFQMDEDQANAEKSVSSMSLMKQNNSTDDIWRNINSNRDCLKKHALERTNALTFALETEEQVVPITDIHDSSKQLQSAADQESSEKEKSGVRGSFENKTILKPSPSVGTSLIHLLPEATNAKSNGSDSGCPSMMDEAWTRLKNSFVYFQSKPVGTLAAALDPSAEELNYNQVYTISTFSLMISIILRRYVQSIYSLLLDCFIA